MEIGVGALALADQQEQAEGDLEDHDSLGDAQQVPEDHRRNAAQPRDPTPHSGREVRGKDRDPHGHVYLRQLETFRTM